MSETRLLFEGWELTDEDLRLIRDETNPRAGMGTVYDHGVGIASDHRFLTEAADAEKPKFDVQFGK